MLNLANLGSSQFVHPNCQIRAMELERQMTSLVSSEELDLALMNPDSILRSIWSYVSLDPIKNGLMGCLTI